LLDEASRLLDGGAPKVRMIETGNRVKIQVLARVK
jgi:hypothetical protein